MPSPTLETRSLHDLVAILVDVGLVGRSQDLADAELIVGWESAVIRSRDGWIYRFGRKDEQTFRRELDVLALVDGRLGVPTPRIEAVDYSHLVMVYRTITGAELYLSTVLRQTPAERVGLTRSLAQVLASMHAMIGTALGGVVVPDLNPKPMVEEVLAIRSKLDRRDRDALDELIASWDSSPLSRRSESPVLLHGDFHFGNMVFSEPTGPVAGIWDFTCVERGEPSADLRYLTGDSSALADEVASAYDTLTGRSLDSGAARLMLALEDITDCIAERRSVRQALDRWQHDGE